MHGKLLNCILLESGGGFRDLCRVQLRRPHSTLHFTPFIFTVRIHFANKYIYACTRVKCNSHNSSIHGTASAEMGLYLPCHYFIIMPCLLLEQFNPLGVKLLKSLRRPNAKLSEFELQQLQFAFNYFPQKPFSWRVFLLLTKSRKQLQKMQKKKVSGRKRFAAIS